MKRKSLDELKVLRTEAQAVVEKIDAMILLEGQEADQESKPLLPQLPASAPRVDLAQAFRARHNDKF